MMAKGSAPAMAIWEPNVWRSPWTRTWGIPARAHAPYKLSRTSFKGPLRPGNTSELFSVRFPDRICAIFRASSAASQRGMARVEFSVFGPRLSFIADHAVKEGFEMGADGVPAFLPCSRREVDLGPTQICVAQEIEGDLLRGDVLPMSTARLARALEWRPGLTSVSAEVTDTFE